MLEGGTNAQLGNEEKRHKGIASQVVCYLGQQGRTHPAKATGQLDFGWAAD
jgi:hypothetical protein